MPAQHSTASNAPFAVHQGPHHVTGKIRWQRSNQVKSSGKNDLSLDGPQAMHAGFVEMI